MSGIRVGDTEREAIAARLRDAAGEGRLTLAETDERLAAAYAARFTEDLDVLVDDLPPVATARPPGHRSAPSSGGTELTAAQRHRLAAHAVVVAVLATVLVGLWAVSAAPFFWPAGPLFWLLISLGVHARRARRSGWRAPLRG